MMALWPCVAALETRLRSSAGGAGRLAIGALRFALVCFALLGAEGLLIPGLIGRKTERGGRRKVPWSHAGHVGE